VKADMTYSLFYIIGNCHEPLILAKVIRWMQKLKTKTLKWFALDDTTNLFVS